ncbi:MAG: HD-GYP domain-containing protein [Ignavibacteria bacterium]
MGHRVIASEIQVGQPLPWDVFDAKGLLLLRRGSVIDSQYALERLVGDGLFLSEKDSREPAARPVEQKPSALQFLMDARRLFGAAHDMNAAQEFPVRMRRIAHLVDKACETSTEVAIASILLLQEGSYVARHQINAAVVANLLGRGFGLGADQIRGMTAAALTMNVSMYEIQDKLNEVRGPLSEKLRELIAAHPEQSAQRLRKLGIEDPFWLTCVAHHHECENGAGYPKGLSGEEIEHCAKIIALADRYCAQVSQRRYRPARTPSAALKEIYAGKGGELNATIVAQLVRVVGLHPPGTIVRMRNGEIGVVIEATDNPDSPLAYALLGPSGAALTAPVLRRTAREDFRIIDVLTADKVDFPIQMSRLWGDAARLN